LEIISDALALLFPPKVKREEKRERAKERRLFDFIFQFEVLFEPGKSIQVQLAAVVPLNNDG